MSSTAKTGRQNNENKNKCLEHNTNPGLNSSLVKITGIKSPTRYVVQYQ